MSDDEIINQLSTETSMVHVSDSGVYEAFALGRVIFDLSQHGSLLKEFIVKLKPEFDLAIVERGPHNWSPFPVEIYMVYHKYAAIEAGTPELGKIEDDVT